MFNIYFSYFSVTLDSRQLSSKHKTFCIVSRHTTSNLISRQHHTNFNNGDNTERKWLRYLASWSYRLQSAPDASNRSTNSTFLQLHNRPCILHNDFEKHSVTAVVVTAYTAVKHGLFNRICQVALSDNGSFGPCESAQKNGISTAVFAELNCMTKTQTKLHQHTYKNSRHLAPLAMQAT